MTDARIRVAEPTAPLHLRNAINLVTGEISLQVDDTHAGANYRGPTPPDASERRGDTSRVGGSVPPRGAFDLVAKRCVDVFLALMGLALLLPVFVLIALAVFLEDRHQPFFRQVRVGKDGRTFRIWKFRSMFVGAERDGLLITPARDPRVTRVGSVLRRTKLDELPQLFNVLTGDLSFVGPRPEVPKYVAMYTSEQACVLELQPGITDPAAVVFADEDEILARAQDPEREYIEKLIPQKVRINLDYAARANLLSDVRIIVVTLARIAQPGRYRKRGGAE